MRRGLELPTSAPRPGPPREARTAEDLRRRKPQASCCLAGLPCALQSLSPNMRIQPHYRHGAPAVPPRGGPRPCQPPRRAAGGAGASPQARTPGQRPACAPLATPECLGRCPIAGPHTTGGRISMFGGARPPHARAVGTPRTLHRGTSACIGRARPRLGPPSTQPSGPRVPLRGAACEPRCGLPALRGLSARAPAPLGPLGAPALRGPAGPLVRTSPWLRRAPRGLLGRTLPGARFPPPSFGSVLRPCRPATPNTPRPLPLPRSRRTPPATSARHARTASAPPSSTAKSTPTAKPRGSPAAEPMQPPQEPQRGRLSVPFPPPLSRAPRFLAQGLTLLCLPPACACAARTLKGCRRRPPRAPAPLFPKRQTFRHTCSRRAPPVQPPSLPSC
jgi:hypothetical protein